MSRRDGGEPLEPGPACGVRPQGIGWDGEVLLEPRLVFC